MNRIAIAGLRATRAVLAFTMQLLGAAYDACVVAYDRVDMKLMFRGYIG